MPVTALTEGSRGLWTANVVTPIASEQVAINGATHRVVPRSVEVLHKQESEVFVRGALAAGDQFITGGSHRIVPNQLVRLKETTPKTTVVAKSHE